MGSFEIFGMTFDILDLLMLAMIIGVAIYSIYTAIRVRREYYFFDNKFLLPGGCKPEDCIDPNGYFDFIAPRLLIFGIMLFLCAAIEIYSLYIIRTIEGLSWLYWVQMLPFLGALIWFVFMQRKAAKLFW